MNPVIRLERVQNDAGTLKYEFSSSLDVFLKNRFSIRYEGLSADVPESVLAVPFAALVAPIAMATGSTLVVPSLDKRFAESLEGCQRYWRRFFPKWGHDRYKLEAGLVANESAAHNGTSLFFSCGLDSLSTFVHNRDSKPHLLSIFGADIPLSQPRFIAECRNRFFDDFAKKQNVGITYISTDIREALDLPKLEKFDTNWYSHVQFGLLYAGLAAPVTYGRFSKVVMASCSHGPGETAPCGADPEVVRAIGWGRTKLEDQLHEVSRVEKVGRFLKTNPSLLRYLRVCWEQFEKPNCSRCKKCLRTICELLVNDIDPNEANFEVDERTLPDLKKRLSSEFRLFTGCDRTAINFWREIQRAADPDKIRDRYGSKEFFRWLAGFEPLKKDEPRALCRLRMNVEKAKRRLSGSK